MLQIQVMGRAGVRLGHLSRQRRLADLTRPQDGDDGERPEPLPDGAHMAEPLDHGVRLP